MPIPYQNSGPIDCTVAPDIANVKGKSVIVTGGSSGIGAAYVKAFLAAGAYVTNGDLQPSPDRVDGENYQFVKCDVRQWKEQLEVFKAAIANSPHRSVDIVIANAGISGGDSMITLDEGDEPVEPDLRIVQINYIGVLYTAKLAVHYFSKQPVEPGRDRCFIITASLASYMDMRGSTLYQTSKFAVRALMCNLRRSERLRVSIICPFFVDTGISGDKKGPEVRNMLAANGLDFALPEDCAKAALRIAADGDINGRAFIVVPRMVKPEGYADVDCDDIRQGSLLYHFDAAANQMAQSAGK